MVSVPFEVTGDGPTISLGLNMFIEFDDMRLAELGRSIMVESVAGGGDELAIGCVSNEDCMRFTEYLDLHNSERGPESIRI